MAVASLWQNWLFVTPFITREHGGVKVELARPRATKSNAQYKNKTVKWEKEQFEMTRLLPWSLLRYVRGTGARLGINPSGLEHHIWAKKRSLQKQCQHTARMRTHIPWVMSINDRASCNEL